MDSKSFISGIGSWNYTVVFDYPQGFCEEFTEEDLAAVDELVCSQLLLKQK
jgi:hypothetical protein